MMIQKRIITILFIYKYIYIYIVQHTVETCRRAYTHIHRNYVHCYNLSCKARPSPRWNFVLMNDPKCHAIAWDLVSCAWKKTSIRPPVFWAMNSRGATASQRSCHFWMPDTSQTCQRPVHLGSIPVAYRRSVEAKLAASVLGFWMSVQTPYYTPNCISPITWYGNMMLYMCIYIYIYTY